MKTEITHADYDLIGAIAKRATETAQKFGFKYPKADAFFDLCSAHEQFNLRLVELLEARDGDFGHDIFGILKHVDRATGEFDGLFEPRFAGGAN